MFCCLRLSFCSLAECFGIRQCLIWLLQSLQSSSREAKLQCRRRETTNEQWHSWDWILQTHKLHSSRAEHPTWSCRFRVHMDSCSSWFSTLCTCSSPRQQRACRHSDSVPVDSRPLLDQCRVWQSLYCRILEIAAWSSMQRRENSTQKLQCRKLPFWLKLSFFLLNRLEYFFCAAIFWK